jgi:hypothetical protein
MVDRPNLQRALDHLADHGAVVLKNPDLWSSFNDGGDWDLYVPDVRRTAGALRGILGPRAFTVRRSYVTAVAYPSNHIDLLPDIRWRGHVLVCGTEIADGARPSPFPLPAARPAHQAIAGCVYPALAHASFKDRYVAVWREAISHDGHELSRLMRRAFGVDLADYADAEQLVTNSSELRRSLLRRDITERPIAVSRRYASFAAGELLVRVRR